MKDHDGGPIKTFGWQLAKAVLAAVVVIVYSRVMGAYGRGSLSILLLNLQMVLMVSELVAGGALANVLSQYPAKRILPTAWIFLLLVLILGYCVGWFQYVLPNQGDLPLNFDHPHIIHLNLLFFQGLFLGSLAILYNVYQVKGWVQQRNKLQVMLEVFKLLGIAFCLEAIHGYLFPRIRAIDLSAVQEVEVPVGQTLDYIHGFDETAVLWILVYASGLACVGSLVYLWKHHAFSDSNHNKTRHPPTDLFRSGVMSQIGHILLFLLYRMPLCWMANEFGNAAAGVLANALLMADTLWIFGNSFGTILHSRMLRWGVNKKKFARLLSLYVVISGLGTLAAIVVLMLLPPNFFVWIFGDTFGGLKEAFVLISPAVLFLGLSAPMGHYLHAQNRFKALILSYGLSLLVLILCWKGMDGFVSPGAVESYGRESMGLMDRIMWVALQQFRRMMAVNLSFFVLLLCNYLQVRKDIKWKGILLSIRRLLRRSLAK